MLLLSKGFTKGRSGYKICRLTWHHAAACTTVQGIYNALKNANISATFGISDKDYEQFVLDENRPWTSSNAENDNQAITFEISNSSAINAATYAEMLKLGDKLGWPVSDDSIKTAIALSAQYVQKYDMGPMIPGKNFTWHSMFTATVCPGPYLLSRMQEIANAINELAYPTPVQHKKLYGVVKQVIALSDESKAKQYASQLNSQGEKDAYYKVIEIGG